MALSVTQMWAKRSQADFFALIKISPACNNTRVHNRAKHPGLSTISSPDDNVLGSNSIPINQCGPLIYATDPVFCLQWVVKLNLSVYPVNSSPIKLVRIAEMSTKSCIWMHRIAEMSTKSCIWMQSLQNGQTSNVLNIFRHLSWVYISQVCLFIYGDLVGVDKSFSLISMKINDQTV